MPETGQRRRFSPLVRDELPRLYSLARRLVGPERAEDLVQDCLLKAYRRFDSLRDEQAARAWFTQILVNCARDVYRRDGREPHEESLDDLPEYSLYRRIADRDPWPYSDTVHLDFLRCFGADDVWRVLDRVKPLYRAPLVLVHMEGFTTAEVAGIFDVPQGTVLSWLHRGRKLFERELWRYAEDRDLLREPKGAGR